MSGRATLGRVADPGAWRAEGACASADDPTIWFAGADEPGKTAETARRQREAVEVCRGCPVLDECLDYALGANERFGIWGGLLPSQRQKMRRSRPARGDGSVRHGTRAAYQYRKCRCAECRAANTRYERAWNKERGAAR